MILGNCAPLVVGELLPDCYSYQKPLRVFFTVQGRWFRYYAWLRFRLHVSDSPFECAVFMKKRRQQARKTLNYSRRFLKFIFHLSHHSQLLLSFFLYVFYFYLRIYSFFNCLSLFLINLTSSLNCSFLFCSSYYLNSNLDLH